MVTFAVAESAEGGSNDVATNAASTPTAAASSAAVESMPGTSGERPAQNLARSKPPSQRCTCSVQRR